MCESFGQITSQEAIKMLTAKPVIVHERALLITINQTYRSGMSGSSCTRQRGVWVIGPRRDGPTSRWRYIRASTRGLPDPGVVSCGNTPVRDAQHIHMRQGRWELRERSPRTCVTRTWAIASERAGRTPFVTSTSDCKRLAPADIRDGKRKKCDPTGDGATCTASRNGAAEPIAVRGRSGDRRLPDHGSAMRNG